MIPVEQSPLHQWPFLLQHGADMADSFPEVGIGDNRGTKVRGDTGEDRYTANDHKAAYIITLGVDDSGDAMEQLCFTTGFVLHLVILFW